MSTVVVLTGVVVLNGIVIVMLNVVIVLTVVVVSIVAVVLWSVVRSGFDYNVVDVIVCNRPLEVKG